MNDRKVPKGPYMCGRGWLLFNNFQISLQRIILR